MITFPTPAAFIASSTTWATALFTEFLTVIAVIVGLVVAGIVLVSLKKGVIGVAKRAGGGRRGRGRRRR